MMNGWILLLLMVVVTNISQVLLKLGMIKIVPEPEIRWWSAYLTNKSMFIGLVLMGIAPVLYILALRDIPLNIAFSFTSVNVIVVQFTGNKFLGEPLSHKKILGSCIICFGLILYSF